MKQKVISFAVMILFTIFLLGFLNSPHPTSTLHEDFYNSSVQKHILDNGITIIIKEDRVTPLVAIEAIVSAGSAIEAEYAGSGIAHFVEHMLFKGTATRAVGEIEKEIKSFGGTINGYTSHDHTSYEIVVPSGYASGATEILKDVLFNSTLNPKEFEKERQVILKEIRLNRDEPASYLGTLLWATAFREHPYRYPVIGYKELFEKLTRADLFKFYKKAYVPNSIVIAIAGDVDGESLYYELKNMFDGVKRCPVPSVETPQEDRQLSKRVLEQTEEIKLAYFGIGFHGVSLFSEDLFALDVLAIILGEGTSSRLNQKLYRELQLVYSVGAWNYTPKDPGLFIISGMADPANTETALKSIRDTVEEVKKSGVSEEELIKAKNAILASYISSRQTVLGQADDLASSEFITGDYNFSKRYIEGVDLLKPEDIKNAAEKYLTENTSTVITLLPESLVKKYVSASRKTIIKNEIQKYALPNGMTVLLREDRRFPLVSIRTFFNGGLRSEKASNNGISNLMAEMLLKGTASRTERDIAETIESLGGEMEYSSGNNSFGISMGLLSRDTNTGIELISDLLLNPAFPPDIFEREKKSVLAVIKSEPDDVYQFCARLVKENLFMVHPYRYRIFGSEESVKNLKVEDIVAHYNRFCRPDNMVLAVFGDIDAKDVLNKIETAFAPFKRERRASLITPGEKSLPARKEIRQKIDKTQSVIMLGFRGTTIFNNDKYTLAVISSILSGYNGRLAMRLRERLGLSYTLGTFSMPGVDPGYSIFYVGTTSENIPTVEKELLKQIELIVNKGVEEYEINLAKNELIGKNKMSLETNSAFAMRVGLDELYGLGYDDYLKFDEYIKAVTASDILRVAKKYLDPEVYTLVTLKGEKSEF